MIREKVQKAISDILQIDTIVLLSPKQKGFGDYAFHKKSIASSKININALKKSGLFEKVEEKCGFINLYLNKNILLEELSEALEKKYSYGKSNWGKNKVWEIEHTSPNPNKAMHIGHLRNNALGMALANIWESIGVKVIRDSVDNNRGIAIAKLMWGYLKFARKDKKKDKTDISYWFSHQNEWETPETSGMLPDRFVDKFYVQGAIDCEQDKKSEEQARRLVLEWENNDKRVCALWKKLLNWSYKGQARTLSRLKNKWDCVWHEHKHYKLGKMLVEEGLKKGIFEKTTENTIITKLSSYKLPDTVLIKSDGTSLYITQDIALTKLKIEKHKAEKLFWVIGPEQTLALKQLFAVCEQLGIGRRTMFKHISYGYVSIKGKGKMSSRKGSVIYADDILDVAREKAKQLLIAHNAQNDTSGTIEEKAEIIGVGAVKYGLLKVARETNIAFDFDESISFTGNCGPYLQYAFARTNSVITKAEPQISKKNYLSPPTTQQEASLLKKIAFFPEILEKAGKDYAPNYLCSYLYELAQEFNAFYEKVPILQSEKKKKFLRLALTHATSIILKKGLKLLGIDILKTI